MASSEASIVYPKTVLRSSGNVRSADKPFDLVLSNHRSDENAELILDYGRCEGGVPVFIAQSACGPNGQDHVPFRVTYSETIDGIDDQKGDGPLFLFSNAMDSYRVCLHHAILSDDPQIIEARFTQASQRYQKITLIQPATAIVFSKVGFRQVRPEAEIKASFHCSDDLLNRIWKDGVRTVDKCTVAREETRPAWDVTDQGTRVYGGHWAPCRQGTRWNDKKVSFLTKIEKSGSSWGIHMVANGLIFCLDSRARKLAAFEGLSHQSSIFPVIEKGSWTVPPDLDLSIWLRIDTLAEGETVTVSIQGQEVACITGIQIRPILNPDVNSGSVAFGGPSDWVALYRDLAVTDTQGHVLYENSFIRKDEKRTFADFQVGTNPLPCTIDGAKRDRACFGGDVFVVGRSIAYSTGDLEAWKGTLKLLLSHQTEGGYVGNLCPVQAPQHEGHNEPPTYAFYSMTYALLLVVSVKDYWRHSGDDDFVTAHFSKLRNQMRFTKNYLNQNGIVEAPPSLSMTWFPMGGPIIGASAGINVAYFDALNAMALMAGDEQEKAQYFTCSQLLKEAILRNFLNRENGTIRLSATLPAHGICQDVNGYALSTGIAPEHSSVIDYLFPTKDDFPTAFRDLGDWDRPGVVSPYASGFALEALLQKGEGYKAMDLLRRVWGVMADRESPNYSGAHWEAMDRHGKPFNHDVSLVHGWSTWPVFLIPRYLAGVYPLEPGWKKVGIEPVLVGLETIEYALDAPLGRILVSINLDKEGDTGTMKILIPQGAIGVVKSPKGWSLDGCDHIKGNGEEVSLLIYRTYR